MMDAVFVGQRLEAVNAEHRRRPGDSPRDDLLTEARELEEESRRLRIPEYVAGAAMRQAQILLDTGRPRESIRPLDRARHALGSLRKHDLLVSILALQAEAHAKLEEWREASAVCTEGIGLVERYRYEVNAAYLQSAYLRSRISLYSRGVQAAYMLSDHEGMLQRAELSKCRSIFVRHSAEGAHADGRDLEAQFRKLSEDIDRLRAEQGGEVSEPLLQRRRVLWDLLSISRFGGQTTQRIPEFSTRAVQSELESDEAIIYYYWVDSGRLLLVTMDRDKVIPELRTLTPTEQDLLRDFANFALTFGPGSPQTHFNQVAQFRESLWPGQEAEKLLQGKRRLLLSPHRLLHCIPFHALWVADGFLIQRYAVTYIPNLSSLLLKYHPSADGGVLLVGVRDFSVPGVMLPPLRQAEAEIEAVERAWKGRGVPVEVLFDVNATEHALRKLEEAGRLREFRCLHFDVHGSNISGDTPMEAYLYLRDSILDGLEISNWQLGCELVVLSACSSGQRPIAGRGLKELPGDEIFGLQAAFFTTGAKRLLSNLWPVESDEALLVMGGFHRYRAGGEVPEIALQRAIKDYLDGANLIGRRVYYWAPFFLSALGRPVKIS